MRSSVPRVAVFDESTFGDNDEPVQGLRRRADGTQTPCSPIRKAAKAKVQASHENNSSVRKIQAQARRKHSQKKVKVKKKAVLKVQAFARGALVRKLRVVAEAGMAFRASERAVQPEAPPSSPDLSLLTSQAVSCESREAPYAEITAQIARETGLNLPRLDSFHDFRMGPHKAPPLEAPPVRVPFDSPTKPGPLLGHRRAHRPSELPPLWRPSGAFNSPSTQMVQRKYRSPFLAEVAEKEVRLLRKSNSAVWAMAGAGGDGTFHRPGARGRALVAGRRARVAL